jgi:hypothetical protein
MILYIETNFIMGVAKGQDNRHDELFAIPAQDLRIAIPSICIMEAWSAFEAEHKRRKRFVDDLISPINETSRDVTSSHAKSLLANLENARVDSIKLLNDVEIRLRRTLGILTGERGRSRVELIPLSHSVLKQSLRHTYMKEPTDNLILTAIVHHAKRHRGVPKALLTANTNDFDTVAIRTLLTGLGVNQFMARTEHFLGWYSARTP